MNKTSLSIRKIIVQEKNEHAHEQKSHEQKSKRNKLHEENQFNKQKIKM